MKIKEICEKTGLTDRTVRYYIEEGLISPLYTENYLGRKSFDFQDEDLERLRGIATLRAFSFTVEEIRALLSKDASSQEIVEAVKKRTEESLDDSRRCLNVLSGLDLSREADILTLAQTLYDSDAAIRNETVRPNPKKRVLSFLKSCALFSVVWLPVLVAAVILIVKFCTLHTPVVRPAFFVATLLCFLPSLLTALIFKKSKKTRKILPALLMSLCVLALPAGAILSSQSVMVCHHRYEAYHTVKEASCSREGERVLKCKDCGDLRTQAISRLPHTEQILAPLAPTCALEGLGEGKICSLCGEITMPQAVIPQTDDHTTVIDAAVSATCKDTGLTEGVHCAVCKKVLVAQTVIPKTEEHTVVTDKGVAATCKSTGLTEGSHCSLCDKVLVAQTVIPQTEDHTVVIDKGVFATCKDTGLTEGSHCSLCNKVLVAQTVIPKTEDHTVVIDKAVSATCKDTGLTEGSHCSVCNKVLVAQTVIPKTDDHTPVTDKAVPATCKDTGLTEGSHCSVCNKVLVAQTVTPKTEDHTPVTDAVVPATCKDTGLTEGSHCSVCNRVLVAQTIVPKTEDHSSSNWIIDVQATCKSEGEKHKECTVCKQVIESEKIEKSVTHTALKNNIEMPSGLFCGDAGSCSVSVSCAVCGEMISSGYQDIPEKHSMANGACQACGLPQSTTTGLYFGLNSDGKSYYVMPGRNFAGGNVVIGVYNNLSVTEVDFVGCDSLTSIVIGDCVERIGSFEACFNLISVTIGDRIREIPEYAFRDCSKLSTITFGDGVEKIGENAFSGCSRLYYAYISGSHDWWCGGDKFYGEWIGKENGMASYFANYLKQYPWEWYRE